MWLVNIQILLHIIAVVCELMVLVSNCVVLLVVNVAFPCRGVVSVAHQGCTMFVHPVWGELLHLYEVCLPVIFVEHMSQVQVWVVGPGLVLTSPDRARSPASHMRGSMGRLTEKTVE